MSKASRHECGECGGTEAYVTRTGANGGYGPALLPGVSKWFRPAKFDVRVCAGCGPVSFHVDQEQRQRMRDSGRWTKIG